MFSPNMKVYQKCKLPRKLSFIYNHHWLGAKAIFFLSLYFIQKISFISKGEKRISDPIGSHVIPVIGIQRRSAGIRWDPVGFGRILGTRDPLSPFVYIWINFRFIWNFRIQKVHSFWKAMNDTQGLQHMIIQLFIGPEAMLLKILENGWIRVILLSKEHINIFEICWKSDSRRNLVTPFWFG